MPWLLDLFLLFFTVFDSLYYAIKASIQFDIDILREGEIDVGIYSHRKAFKYAVLKKVQPGRRRVV